MTKQDVIRNSGYEDQILYLIDNADQWTRSDLQASVGALVLNIVRASNQAGRVEVLKEWKKNLEKMDEAFYK